MKLHIFQKLDRSYFTRIGVDLVSFQEHSIAIQCGKGVVELFWDEGYSFKDLHYGDVLLIYIIGEDFSRGHVLPIVRALSMSSMTVESLVKSKLDRMNQENKRHLEILTQVLKAISEFYLNWSLDDFNTIRDVIEASDVDDKMLDNLKNSIEKRKAILMKNSS
jgi:hypothetical protein